MPSPSKRDAEETKMGNPRNCDYKLSKADANELMGITCLPDEFRVLALKRLLSIYGRDGLVRLFSQFIGVANSVGANTREFIEVYLITECDHQPHLAEQINLPTVQGALTGIEVAIEPVKGMCHGCAFRLGTCANQSPVTSLDAKWAQESSGNFMCHEIVDDKGEPTQKCIGYAKQHAAIFAEAQS